MGHDSSSQRDSKAVDNAHLPAQERRVADAMELYLLELESGRLPQVDQFVKMFPGLERVLANELKGLEIVHGLAAELRQPEQANGSERGHGGRIRLGDFQIVRPIGRGGMGVVYEAKQLSLERRVALKVLPYAAVLDRHQLQRFHNEARAAATLDHPNIVPVYFVGQDRGVHFYAMKMIDGYSFAELLNSFRTGSRQTPKTARRTPVSDLPTTHGPSDSDQASGGTSYCRPQCRRAISRSVNLSLMRLRQKKPTSTKYIYGKRHSAICRKRPVKGERTFVGLPSSDVRSQRGWNMLTGSASCTVISSPAT